MAIGFGCGAFVTSSCFISSMDRAPVFETGGPRFDPVMRLLVFEARDFLNTRHAICRQSASKAGCFLLFSPVCLSACLSACLPVFGHLPLACVCLCRLVLPASCLPACLPARPSACLPGCFAAGWQKSRRVKPQAASERKSKQASKRIWTHFASSQLHRSGVVAEWLMRLIRNQLVLYRADSNTADIDNALSCLLKQVAITCFFLLSSQSTKQDAND